MHATRESHLEAVICILRYLKSVTGKELFFMRNNHLQVEANTDSNYRGQPQAIIPLLEVISLLGVIRNKLLLLGRVMAQEVCELLWIGEIVLKVSNFRDCIRYFWYDLIRRIWYYMTRSFFPSLVEDFFFFF